MQPTNNTPTPNVPGVPAGAASARGQSFDFAEARELAWDNLQLKGQESTALWSMARVDDSIHGVVVPFFGEEYAVNFLEKKVISPSGCEANPFFATLVLHYLAGAGPNPLSGELINFKQLRGGDIYFPAFNRNSLEPIRAAFDKDSGALAAAAERLGGERLTLGDLSYRIPVFPKLPLVVVLYEGEGCMIPSAANILFDSTAPDMMDREDLAAICALLAGKLSR